MYNFWVNGVSTSFKFLVEDSIASISSDDIASSNDFRASSTCFFSSSSSLSSDSSIVFLVAWTNISALFLVLTSSSNFLSSSAFASASFTIFSISSSDNPLDAFITIDCSLPVFLSLADTLRIPLASKSNETSICGTPLVAAGISVRLNWPSDLFWDAWVLSPWITWTVTAVWLSSAVENTWDFCVGIVVFFSINGVATPPRVSIPRVRGVTSSNKTSVVSPDKTEPWIAAPTATASSGFKSFLGSFPKNSDTFFWTRGILVCPPTNKISFISPFAIFASFKANFKGSKLFSTKSSTRDSSFALVILWTKCFGPELSAVI